MLLSQNLKKILKSLEEKGFEVQSNAFDEEIPDTVKPSGKIVYKRVVETYDFDNQTKILPEISSLELKLYLPQNSEEVEDAFFDVLQFSGACFEVEDFDVCVTAELVKHTILITAI